MAKIILTGGPSFALFNPSLHVSLGLLYLGAALRQAGHDVKIVDCHKLTAWDEERGRLIILKEMLEPCDILGVSCVTPNAEFGGQLAEAWPAKVKVGGGPHVSYILNGPHAQFKHRRFFKGFDYLMTGECEDSFVQFCNEWDTKHCSLKDYTIAGLGTFNYDGTVTCNPPPVMPDVTKMPLPAYDLWDGEWGKGGLIVQSQHGKSVDVAERTIGSLFTSRGCLPAGTPIMLAAGMEAPIEMLQVGDVVQSFDVEKQVYTEAPIQNVWEREADDLWELELGCDRTIRITGEHPVWTKKGWVTVKGIKEGDFILSRVRERVFEVPMQCVSEILQRRVLQALAAERIGTYDGGREAATLESPTSSYERSKKDIVFNKDGRQESYEEGSSSEKSVGYDEAQVDCEAVEPIEFEMETGDDADAVATNPSWKAQKSIREKTRRLIGTLRAAISLCGERRILGGAMQVWGPQKPGLCRYKEQEHHTSSRSLLASIGQSQSGEIGLRRQGLGCTDYLGEGIEADVQDNASKAPSYVWRRVVAKKFIGRSKVYNITVCSTHNYFANGYLVHNCPYQCSFCADARTKLRDESVAQVEAEVKWLAEHGITSLRIWDDVLTVKAKRCMELVDIFHNYGMLWRGWSRVNLMDPKLFEYMATRGCTEMGFGVEHGSKRMLKAMSKGTTPDANTIGIKICQDAGIVARAYLLIGFPGETWESIGEMQQWLDVSRPDAASLHMFQPYPGCEVWIHPEKFGIKELPENAFSKMWELNDDDPSTLILDLPTMTKAELFQARTQLGTWIKDNISMRPANR
jgi:radical SAM superfamily enzyme YgiQ (UPF0313 family)